MVCVKLRCRANCFCSQYSEIVNVYFIDNVGLIMNLDIEKWIENKMRHISFLFSNKDYLALSDYLEYGNAIYDNPRRVMNIWRLYN